VLPIHGNHKDDPEYATRIVLSTPPPDLQMLPPTSLGYADALDIQIAARTAARLAARAHGGLAPSCWDPPLGCS